METENLDGDGGVHGLEKLSRPSGIDLAQKSAPDIREWSNPCNQRKPAVENVSDQREVDTTLDVPSSGVRLSHTAPWLR